MARSLFHRFFLLVLFTACLTLSAVSAYAKVAGCNDSVAAAQRARADAEVAAYTATLATMKPPPSLSQQTCLERSSIAAGRIGNSFSGSLTGIIKDAWRDFKDQLAEITHPSDPNAPPSAEDPTRAATDYYCDEMDKTWKASQKEQINPTALLQLDFHQLVSVSGGIKMGGMDPLYAQGLVAAKDLFSKADTTEKALPRPAVPDLSKASSFCDVLKASDPSTKC